MHSGTLQPSWARLLKLGAGGKRYPARVLHQRVGHLQRPVPPSSCLHLLCRLESRLSRVPFQHRHSSNLGRSLALFLAPCLCLCRSSSLPQFTSSISLGFCLTSFFHHFFVFPVSSHCTPQLVLSLLGVGHPCASPKSFPCRCPSLHLFLPVCVPITARWQPAESTRASERRKGLTY